MVILPFSDQHNSLQTFYLISALIAFHLLQKIITSENKNYILVFIIVLALLGYEVYQRHQKIKNDLYDKKESFIENIIEKTTDDDKQQGMLTRKYNLAFALLNSENVLWKTLKEFKKMSNNEPNAYEKIVILIVRYYEDYGKLLKKKVSNVSPNVLVTDMLMKRQEIMNAIQEFHLQSKMNRKMDKAVKSFSILILACLDKCIRVIRNKYKIFHSSAPYAFNLMGDELQLY